MSIVKAMAELQAAWRAIPNKGIGACIRRVLDDVITLHSCDCKADLDAVQAALEGFCVEWEWVRTAKAHVKAGRRYWDEKAQTGIRVAR